MRNRMSPLNVFWKQAGTDSCFVYFFYKNVEEKNCKWYKKTNSGEI